MVSSLKTAMSSGVVLFTILVQSAYGTFFPPVSNPPPIPAQGVRTLNNGPPGYYVQDDSTQDFPIARDEGLLPPDTQVDDQRWYLQDNQSNEGGQFTRDTFERFYQNGEPAIGPVATPIPDEAYIAESSSISRLNPNGPGNSLEKVWILTRGSENQYIPQRWIQVQVPSERVIEVSNQDSGPPPVATDPVKSVVAPDIPVKSQFTANSPANIVQQVWVQAPNTVNAATYGKSATIVEEIPSVKQIVDIPRANGKQIVQQQVIKNAPSPIITPAPVFNTKSFSVPPPLPPPIKGDISSKSIPPVNVIPDSNVIVGGKNTVYQRLRHVWIPTSSRTGKFITYPVQANINPGKSVINPELSLAPTPITVSDTWVLKQDGPLAGFEQQKYPLPPPTIQSGKVIIQNPPVVQVNNQPSPKILAQVSSPKAPIGKGVIPNDPVDIWPVRKDTSPKISDKSIVVSPDISGYPIQTDAISINKGIPLPPVAPQKTLTKSAIPVPVPPPSLQVINGKPCPLSPPVPQKSLFPPPSPSVITAPKVVGTSRLPLTRIIRVNGYPTGRYYLLNTRMRPNYFAYPNQVPIIQQQKTRYIQIVQPNQIPLQGKQPIVQPQAKRIMIPVQSKQFVPPVPARQVTFPFVARQAIVSLPPKSTRLVYPAVQAIRYPWSGLTNYQPIPGKGIVLPQFGSLKVLSLSSDSSSSSDSNSSESSSSSESEEKKEEKTKKEEKPKKEDKPKEEEKPKSEESSSSSEGEKESSSVEKESEESTSESKTEEESIEAAESQISHAPANIAVLPVFGHILDQESGSITTIHGHNYPEGFHSEPHHEAEPRTESHESTHVNFIPSHMAHNQGETNHALEGSTEDVTTEFNRD